MTNDPLEIEPYLIGLHVLVAKTRNGQDILQSITESETCADIVEVVGVLEK
jgi:hypothetical protein